MTNWRPDISQLRRPAYLSLAEQIARAIQEGLLPNGTRLLPHRKLADDLKLSVQTVSRAYDELIRRGLISGEIGRGSFVQTRPREPEPPYLPERLGELVDLSILKPVCEQTQSAAVTQAQLDEWIDAIVKRRRRLVRKGTIIRLAQEEESDARFIQSPLFGAPERRRLAEIKAKQDQIIDEVVLYIEKHPGCVRQSAPGRERPFTLSMPLTPLDGGKLLPYDCHEGNYAILQSLGGERAEDRALEADRKKGIIRERRPIQGGLGVGGQPISEGAGIPNR